jgi:hypothetical protein
MQADFSKIIPLISNDRFEGYRHSGESDEIALARLLWNVALCEAFYPSLQALEVAFRNRVHHCIGGVVPDGPDWILTASFLYEDEREILDAAKSDLALRNRPVTAAYLISELKFGFWTSLADSRYDTMWHKIIRCVFPNAPAATRTRAEVSRRLNRVRNLRNSIFHHHSIWHWHDLEDHRNNILTMLDWIEPEYAGVVRKYDRFEEIWKNGHQAFI